MIKLIAALLFTAAGSLCGMISSGRLALRKEICHEVQLLFRETAFLIRHQGRNVYEIAGTLKKEKILGKLTFLNGLPEDMQDGNFREKWASAVKRQRDIPEEVKLVLLEAGEILGKSDTAGQISLLEMFAEKSADAEKKFTAEYVKKSKLFRSVGLLAGMMIGIIII